MIEKMMVKNFKGVKQATIEFAGRSLLFLYGANESGKTSFCDGVTVGLVGKRNAKKSIRSGEKEAEILVENENYAITRHIFADKKEKLEIVDKSTGEIVDPKTLDNLFGSLGYDPGNFYKGDDSKQFEILGEGLGINVYQYKQDRKAIYDDRSHINRQVKELRPLVEDEPEEATQVNVAELMESLEQFDRMKAMSGAAEAKRQYSMDAIESSNSRLAELRADINRHLAIIQEEQAKVAQLDQYIQGAPYDESAHQEIKDQLTDAAADNVAYEEYKRFTDNLEKMEGLEQKSALLTEKIKKLDKGVADKINNAGLQDGIVVTDGVICNGDVPLSECASSFRWKFAVSVAILLAQGKEFPLVIIREGGDLLDENNIKVLADLVKTGKVQALVERVNPVIGDKGNTITISEGELAG